jgi:hypothetical protein
VVTSFNGGTRRLLAFPEFLTLLFNSLASKRVRACILRNYEGFPTENAGSDLDFLIAPEDMPPAVSALYSIERIRVVGCAERFSGTSFFVEGVEAEAGSRAFQIDFITGLNWKGSPFLTTSAVLDLAIERRVGGLTFLVPSPIHEAIVSLFSGLLVGGVVKEKYFPRVQGTFSERGPEVVAALAPQFGSRVARRLADAVIAGDRRKILKCIRPLRRSLAIRSLYRHPISSIHNALGHYRCEFAVRRLPGTLHVIRISGAASRFKDDLVSGLLIHLKNAAKVIEPCDFNPKLPPQLQDGRTGLRSMPAALRTIHDGLRWLFAEWLCRFESKPSLKIRLHSTNDFETPDTLLHFGSRKFTWCTDLIHKLVPAPAVWLAIERSDTCVSDPKVRVVRLDLSQPPELLLEQAYAAIIEGLAERTSKKLSHRFSIGPLPMV